MQTPTINKPASPTTWPRTEQDAATIFEAQHDSELTEQTYEILLVKRRLQQLANHLEHLDDRLEGLETHLHDHYETGH